MKTSSTRVAYIAKKLREHLIGSAAGQRAFDRLHEKEAGFVEFCAKLAFAIPQPGQIMASAKRVGGFSGRASQNFLKPPGSATAAVTNPRLNLRSAMTKANRV